jgi:hypothetical protein
LGKEKFPSTNSRFKKLNLNAWKTWNLCHLMSFVLSGFFSDFSPIFKACKSGTKSIGSPHRTTTPINCVGTFVFSLILETRKTNKFVKI